jgi:hypothetical protein
LNEFPRTRDRTYSPKCVEVECSELYMQDTE